MTSKQHLAATATIMLAMITAAAAPADSPNPADSGQGASQERGRRGQQRERRPDPVGYTDTPVIPGQKWRVHDIDRPRPKVVNPGPPSSPVPPPADAIVLFNGTDLSKWVAPGRGPDRGKTVPARWKIENGYMEVNRTGSISTTDRFGDCQLHVEWASPIEVRGNSQGRGNSGVFLMGIYEIQVLDSYDNLSYADGQAGSIYGQHPPMVNASRGPGEWQSFDIIFEAPRFEGDKLAKPAYLTVLHNGVLIHHRQEILGKTEHKRVGNYAPHPDTGPIMLQDHSNPVRFRNIWIRPLKSTEQK